jgi:hypothetical protein
MALWMTASPNWRMHRGRASTIARVRWPVGKAFPEPPTSCRLGPNWLPAVRNLIPTLASILPAPSRYSAQVSRLVLALLGVSALLAFLGPIVEGRDRAAERAVRSYLDAIQSGNVDAALETLDPLIRPEWRIFAEHQAGDRFRVLGLAVQREPLLDGVRRWGQARSVTVTAELEGKGGERWQATSYVEGHPDGERWLLERPVFGPDEPWLVPPGD